MDASFIGVFFLGLAVGAALVLLLNVLNNRRKAQFEQQTGTLQSQLDQLNRLIRETEGQRQVQYGSLSSSLQTLTDSTSKLQSILANERQRGAWGEQVASGILQAAGFVNGTHYIEQSVISDGTTRIGRPDFTFLLPNGLTIHMDVKFPFNNYENYLKPDGLDDSNRRQYLRQFFKDAKDKIDETCKYVTRDTLDCVLMFIPNEALFHFLSENESIRAYALQKKVIICSPLSLLVVLAIIRQASEIFGLEKSLGEIQMLVKSIADDLSSYVGELDKVEGQLLRTQELVSELKLRRTQKLRRNSEKLQSLLFKQNGALSDVELDA